MAIIGSFKSNGGGYAGHVRTMKFNAPVTITPCPKTGDNAPDFQVYSGRVHIGAAWKKTGDAGDYLRVSIDDASLSEPLYASLFTAAANDAGEFDLVWSRSRKRA